MLLDTNVDHLAEILSRGVQAELEKKLREKFELLMDGLVHELIAPTVSQLARDLAQQTATQIKAYQQYSPMHAAPEIRVQLVFNNQAVGYIQPEADQYESILQPDGSIKLVKKT